MFPRGRPMPAARKQSLIAKYQQKVSQLNTLIPEYVSQSK